MAYGAFNLSRKSEIWARNDVTFKLTNFHLYIGDAWSTFILFYTWRTFIHCTALLVHFFKTQKQARWLVNRVMRSFHSVLIKVLPYWIVNTWLLRYLWLSDLKFWPQGDVYDEAARPGLGKPNFQVLSEHTSMPLMCLGNHAVNMKKKPIKLFPFQVLLTAGLYMLWWKKFSPDETL